MTDDSTPKRRLAFIGGTGPEGRGLALRFASVGFPILIGSRFRERAEETASALRDQSEGARIDGMPNEEAAAAGDIAILTVPYAALKDTLQPIVNALRAKVVVSAVAPTEFQDGRLTVPRVEAGSAAEEVQQRLSESRVVSAFQTIDAYRLQHLEMTLDTDVIVCSDDAEARHDVMDLVGHLSGARALSGGRLVSSRYVEQCTALLITINRIYKVHSGVRITGVEK